jgi:GNAT superfamily N-acetyltransferase
MNAVPNALRDSGHGSIAHAVEVFARGFCVTRSFTHPYVPDRVGPVWAVRDGPRRGKQNYRREEWIACGVPPRQVDRIAREQTRGGFAVCAIDAADEPDQPTRAGYKALGYRLGATEALMVHRLKRVPRCDTPAAVIERVRTQEMADHLAKSAGSRQVLPEHLSRDSNLRQYVALHRDELVGWVRSIVIGNATWCSNMFVKPAFRRRGIARAMLCRMLRDDRAHGAEMAILLASHAGAKLYPVVGYERIGTLLLFTPPRKR